MPKQTKKSKDTLSIQKEESINPLMTNRSLSTLPPSSISGHPPLLVQALIDSKLLQKTLISQVKTCKANEDKAKNDYKKLLMEKVSGD